MIMPSAPRNRRLWTYDVEVFPNHFLATFYNGTIWKTYDETQLAQMAKDLDTVTLVLAGYNNFGYDDIIVKYICQHPEMTPQSIYELSKAIIEDESERTRQCVFELQYQDPTWDYSIDVFQLLNGKTSLKEMECRIGFDSVLESPLDFHQPVPDDRRADVLRYCQNDVKATAELLIKHWDRVVLRSELDKQYQLGKRVYCQSEQGLAQSTFLTLHRRRTNERSADVRQAATRNPDNQKMSFPMSEILSPKIRFTTPEMREFIETFSRGSISRTDTTGWKIDSIPSFHGIDVVTVAAFDDGTEVVVPSQPVKYDKLCYKDVEYQIGVGGLHSIDGPLMIHGSDDVAIVDMDVASYYPSIIINDNLYPAQIGPDFVTDMRMLRDQRVSAKRRGDKKTADALKIVINATFGKLDDKYSPLRSAPHAKRVTINGQMYLFMLIERVVAAGATVLSANTDGITVRIDRVHMDAMKAAAKTWEAELNFELEYVEYASIFRRDVNDYMAVTVDGKIKYKGAINSDGGKGDGTVIKKAAEAFLLHGVPPDVTIQSQESVKPFLFYMRSKNGGTLYHGDTALGKTARWYAATEGPSLRRLNPATAKRKGGWKLEPHGERVSLAMDVTDVKGLPNDIDFAYYERAAWALIDHLGPTQ